MVTGVRRSSVCLLGSETTEELNLRHSGNTKGLYTAWIRAISRFRQLWSNG